MAVTIEKMEHHVRGEVDIKLASKDQTLGDGLKIISVLLKVKDVTMKPGSQHRKAVESSLLGFGTNSNGEEGHKSSLS